MKENSDFRLWRRFKKGDKSAISLVYHQYADLLFSYGKRLTLDDSLVLDTIQDLFIYLIQNKTKLGDTDNVKAYIQKAFRRRLVDELKKKSKTISLDSNERIEPDLTFPIEDDLINEEALTTKQRELKKALEQLSSQQREILHYRFNGGFDYAQISEIMSISVEAARQNVSRAIKLLRKKLDLKSLMTLLFIGSHLLLDLPCLPKS
ncbi:MAG: RNA polymerase sigma factor [Bacteroidales bacterium]